MHFRKIRYKNLEFDKKEQQQQQQQQQRTEREIGLINLSLDIIKYKHWANNNNNNKKNGLLRVSNKFVMLVYLCVCVFHKIILCGCKSSFLFLHCEYIVVGLVRVSAVYKSDI